ncbi:hypothetical protein A0H81_01210 [Grifola frondosa]|uniref:Uncharacterized protein n=1 Tax=Grifola frondosa TaxID=5627 RepID=A0A1C7MQI5_GRIFR|nr:hypothetical protein A0H81_01210 [Grifola frondosa]
MLCRWEKILDALCVIASSRNPRLIPLLGEMLAHLPIYFGIHVDSQVHDAILRGFLIVGDSKKAYEWLVDMPSKPGNSMPTLDQWHELIRANIEGESGFFAQRALESMKKFGSTPGNDTFKIVFEGLFRSPNPPGIELIRDFIHDMKSEGLAYDPTVIKSIMAGYHKAQMYKHAEEADLVYHTTFGTTTADGSNPTTKRLITIFQTRGQGVAASYYRRLEEMGFKASQNTLLAMADTLKSDRALAFWEGLFHIKGGAEVWTKILWHEAQAGKPASLLALYKRALSSGVRPTNSMLHLVLRALCSSGLRPPSESTIDTAMELFRDFVDRSNDEMAGEDTHTRKKDVTDLSTLVSKTSTSKFQPDTPIYNTLLRALISSQNVTKYYPMAMSLLEDMRSRDAPIDHMTATSMVVMLMRCSPSAMEAFNVYQLVCKPKYGKPVLDQEGYVTPDPPSRLYFEIVRDMRTAGFNLSGKVYTIILSQLAHLGSRLASSDDEAARDQLVNSIRRTHNFLTVDASLSPDTAVWNSLMDAYQRAGCFAEAFRVWEMLDLSAQYDEASVSIVLDTCAYAQAYEKAVQIYSKLLESRFPFNLRNWNNWLECLCRLGRVDEALKVLCLEMPNARPAVEPNEGSVRILLKFASRANQEGETRARIKRYLPDLWAKLPQELQRVY